ncbi:MAG TPA: hypothetical protein PKW07_08595 [Syntrophorhabdaceae bacterium]|nr:hypothetical protein [Syntrophorhabdaceae bacterium]
MPLVFETLNYGEIPFGFFNIETDALVLDNYFFFASDMADHISQIADIHSNSSYESNWYVYRIEPQMIGNLMGAIAGIDLRGLIGEIYSHFPFPHEPERFRQNPEGYKTRPLIEEIIMKYTQLSQIKVIIDEHDWTFSIGDYRFSRYGFHELIRYLWLGGYPRWKDNVRPDYIKRMRKKIEDSIYPIFDGLKEILSGQ